MHGHNVSHSIISSHYAESMSKWQIFLVAYTSTTQHRAGGQIHHGICMKPPIKPLILLKKNNDNKGQVPILPRIKRWKWVNTHKNETISLVDAVLKVNAKLATRASEARFWASKSSL